MNVTIRPKKNLVRVGLIHSLIAGAIISASSCAHVSAANEPPIINDPRFAEIDEVVEKGIEERFFPGGVVIVGQHDNILYAKAYGKQRYDEDAPAVTLDTIYDMASLTKVVASTSAALILLTDEQLRLDALAGEYIENFNQAGKENVTLSDLMVHCSGLKAYESSSVVEQKRPEDQNTADALINHYAALPASYTPGEKIVYSCLNFQSVARISENVSGTNLDAFLKERMFGPLGMKDSTYIVPEADLSRTAPTFRTRSGEYTPGVVHDPLARYHGNEGHNPGNAGLFSTAPDLARFCQMLLAGGTYNGKRIISEDVIKTAFANHSPEGERDKRGLGWDLYDSAPYVTKLHGEDGSQIVGHTGFTGTMIWMDERTGAYWIFLTNRTFPTNETETDSSKAISSHRQAIARIVLQAMPEYREYFGEQPTPAS